MDAKLVVCETAAPSIACPLSGPLRVPSAASAATTSSQGIPGMSARQHSISLFSVAAYRSWLMYGPRGVGLAA